MIKAALIARAWQRVSCLMALVLLVGPWAGVHACTLVVWSQADAPDYARQIAVSNSNTGGFTSLQYIDGGHGGEGPHGGWSPITVSVVSYPDDARALAQFQARLRTLTAGGYTRKDESPTYERFDRYWSSSAGLRGGVYLVELMRQSVVVEVSASVYPTDIALPSIDADLLRELTDAEWLVHRKCGPSVTIWPDPNVGLGFHKSVAKGEGFGLVVRDMSGIENIDDRTFKVYVAGVDKTSHFVNQVFRRGLLQDSFKTEVSLHYWLPVGAGEFGTDDNLFNIAWNGTWPVALEICNRSGQCDRTEYRIYFGPFVDIGSATDGRCQSGDDRVESLEVFDVVAGNIGFPAPQTQIFLGVMRKDDGDHAWTYQLYSPSQGGFRPGIARLLELPLQPGFYYHKDRDHYSERLLGAVDGLPTAELLERDALLSNPALQHELVFTAVDLGISDFHLGRVPLSLCAP